MRSDPSLRPERATLIVPGLKPAMIAKAASSIADAVCIDLEDAVAPDQKAGARGHVIEALNSLEFGGKMRQVRVNALDTPYAYRDIVDLVEGAAAHLDLIVLPKVERAEDVVFLDILLGQIEAALGSERRIGIAAMIETARGLVSVNAIASASPRLEALIFGSGDFAASMGMPLETIGGEDGHDQSYPGHRWHFVQQAIMTAARANGLRAIDGPYADFRDESGLDHLSIIGRALGFDGKWCIHPAQLAGVTRAFTPSDVEIEQARKVLHAYEAAQAAGTGVITVDGKMVDAANLRMCRRVLAMAGPGGASDG